jgi:tetratricopeptide (TPR) repeat protein
VSIELANKLMGAESAEAFLRDQGVASSWETVASIKSEVDRLVGADLNAASRLAERVEQLAATLGDPVSKAFAEASRARVLHHSGRHAEATALYDSALGGMRAAKLAREGAVIQTHQVYALTQMGRYDEARRTASLARRVLARGESRQLAQLETNIGTIYYRLDRYKKALQHYDRARELLGHNGDAATRAFVDFSRSNILTDTDQPDEALALLESAAAAWEASGLNLLAAQARFHIAYVQFLRGNYHTALTTYYQVRDQLQEFGSPVLAAWCSQEIGEILLALNAFDDAAESAAAAKVAFAELGMPYESAQATIVRALAAMGLQQ